MKSARLLLILLGLLLALGALVGGLALTPAVQRWAVLRTVNGQPGTRFDATTVAVGLSSIRLEGVRWEQGGLRVQLTRLGADFSLRQLLFSRRLVLGRLTADGLLVDASRLSRRETGVVAAGAPAAAPGLLARIELPVVLAMGDCVLEGRALLAGAAGQPPLEAAFKVTGGNFSPGQEGTLRLSATLRNPVATAGVATLHADVLLRAIQTEQKTFRRVGLTAVVDTEAQKLAEKNQLKITATLIREGGGENYVCSVDTLIRGTAENVLALQAALPAGRQSYAGEWKLLARTAQLAPFFLGQALPEFSARGEGRFTLNPATNAASLQGSLQADVSRLEAVEPAWRAIGAVRATAQFDLAEADGVARLNQLQVTLAGDQPVLQLSAARAAELNFRERRLQVGGSAPGEALNLTLYGLPLAWVRPFVHAVDISGGQVTGQLAITGEADHLSLRAIQPLHIDQLNIMQAGHLLLARAEVTAAIEAVLTAQELQLAVHDFGVKTPAGDTLSAQAKVSLPTGPAPAVAVQATFTADLPTLLNPWLPLGRVRAGGEIDCTLAGPKADLRQLNVRLTDAAGLEFFRINALQPFHLDLEAHRLTAGLPASAPPGGTVELLQVHLGRLPLGALPLSNLKLGGEVTQGELLLALDGEKIILRATSPVKLADVALGVHGQPALSGLSLEAQPQLELIGAGGLRFQTGDMVVRTGRGNTLLTLKGEVAQASATADLLGTVTFGLEIPALATQPLFAGAQAVSAGRASGELRAALGKTKQLEARMTVNGLVATEANQTLPVANLSLRVVAAGDGRLSVQAPLLLDRSGQRSDLNFALEVAPAGRGYSVEGKLTGDHLELQDAVSVLGVFLTTTGTETPAETRPGPVGADPAPAWSPFTGRLLLDVKSVARGSDWAMTGLSGLVVLEPTRLALQKLEATFGEQGRFGSRAVVNFSGGAQPYTLSGDFSLTEFDAGKLFKALDPGKPAVLEGMFTVAGQFTGQGETLERLRDRSHGTFDLTSRQGVFRGLQRTSNKLSMTSKAVELGASVLGSLFGSEKVTKTAEKVAGQAYFVDQLAQNLAEINYDQFSMKLARDEALNVALDDISFVSPEIRLIGKGTITYAADKPLLEQPLSASLSIAGRGKLEQLLGKLRLLDGTKDELGYSRTREPVTLAGTLARPDPTAYFTRIASAKLNELLAPEN